MGFIASFLAIVFQFQENPFSAAEIYASPRLCLVFGLEVAGAQVYAPIPLVSER